MVAAFIVLMSIALIGGGYIAFDAVKAHKTSALRPEASIEEKEGSTETIVESETAATDSGPTESEVAPAEATEEKEGSTEAIVESETAATETVLVTRYNRSFTARLIQSEEAVKRYYSELRNGLLDYGAISRVCWGSESFRVGKTRIAKLRFRRGIFAACFALDPQEYEGNKNLVALKAKSYAATPTFCKVENDEELSCALDLVDEVANKFGLSKTEREKADYAALLPLEETDALVERKLIKIRSDRKTRSDKAYVPSENLIKTIFDKKSEEA